MDNFSTPLCPTTLSTHPPTVVQVDACSLLRLIIYAYLVFQTLQILLARGWKWSVEKRLSRRFQSSYRQIIQSFDGEELQQHQLTFNNTLSNSKIQKCQTVRKAGRGKSRVVFDDSSNQHYSYCSNPEESDCLGVTRITE